MSNEFLANWGVPIAALIAGAFSYSLVWFGAWRFDRKYGREPK
jgi:hypothetical protein